MPTLHRVQVVVCFNSRTPGGVRQTSTLPDPLRGMFQFTHPGRGATWVGDIWTLSRESFNSRTPGGVRQICMPTFLIALRFQFTHPGRGATQQGKDINYEAKVSIHAPREGCDPDNEGKSYVERSFQFTHPGRGATIARSRASAQGTFQFTHPGRGATVANLPFVLQGKRFNSRTPGGVRRVRHQG